MTSSRTGSTARRPSDSTARIDSIRFDSIQIRAELHRQHPELVEIVDIGDSWDKVTPGGADGYDLQVTVLTNESIVGPKPRFFLMGSIHAREYATAELALRFAEQVVAGYGTDPTRSTTTTTPSSTVPTATA